MENIIRLFRAVPIKTKQKGKVNNIIQRRAIQNGFLLTPEIFGNFSEHELLVLLERVINEIGLNSRQINNAFHKSWNKIKTATDEQLLIEQIVHYITTYGFEALGIYNSDSVYIPTEKLKIPKIDLDKIRLIVIKGYTKEEIKEKLLALLQTGIALKEDTKQSVLEAALYCELNEKEVRTIKNKEVKSALYEYLGIVPENPTEFLRYIIYKATEKTLVIQNKELIEEIKAKKNLNVAKLFLVYKEKYGLERLAEIFLRFKPLFLAFKTNSQSKKLINKISKLAVKFHKPMAEDYLNTITTKLKEGRGIDEKQLQKELSKVNIFRKIRLAYALSFRTKDIDSIVYKVRNGKSYAAAFNFDNKVGAMTILKKIIDSIVKDIKPQVEGKKIYIPKNIKYALPATEKQFSGNIPSGSYLTITKDVIVGVHWENVKHNRIDLDLSMINLNDKYGWDSDYRNDDRTLLFSGDLTDAQSPRGASELFYVRKQEEDAFIMSLNYFNFDDKTPVPFKLFIASESVKNMRKDYMVDPNNVLVTIDTKITERQKTLGLLVTTPKENRFYFSETGIGSRISSKNSEVTEHSRKYMMAYLENPITLNDLFEKAGAKIVTDDGRFDINLSPEALEKDTIIKLLKIS